MLTFWFDGACMPFSGKNSRIWVRLVRKQYYSIVVVWRLLASEGRSLIDCLNNQCITPTPFFNLFSLFSIRIPRQITFPLFFNQSFDFLYFLSSLVITKNAESYTAVMAADSGDYTATSTKQASVLHHHPSLDITFSRHSAGRGLPASLFVRNWGKK